MLKLAIFTVYAYQIKDKEFAILSLTPLKKNYHLFVNIEYVIKNSCKISNCIHI